MDFTRIVRPWRRCSQKCQLNYWLRRPIKKGIGRIKTKYNALGNGHHTCSRYMNATPPAINILECIGMIRNWTAGKQRGLLQKSSNPALMLTTVLILGGREEKKLLFTSEYNATKSLLHCVKCVMNFAAEYATERLRNCTAKWGEGLRKHTTSLR